MLRCFWSLYASRNSCGIIWQWRAHRLIKPFLFIRGLSCLLSFQTSLSQNFLKVTIPGFPYNLLPVSCGDFGFKSIGQALAWKSGLKVPLLSLWPSRSVQTVQLSDLVGWVSPLQIVIAFWRSFLIWSSPNSHYSLQLAPTPDPTSLNKRSALNGHYYLRQHVI